MGLLKDLQKARNEQTRVNRNTETLGRELQRDLSKEDLSDMIRLMNEPEVYNPLFEHAEAFGRQPAMDDVLRTQFRLRVTDILGDKKNQNRLNDVLDRFDRTEIQTNETQDTRRLADKLSLSGRDDEPFFVDKVTERIQKTRQEINDRVEYQKEKVKGLSKDASRAVERRVRPLVDVAQDNVRGLIQGVKTRVQSFKDDYRTRQRAIENSQNWETALDKGVSEEQIKNAINHADFPEVRYGVMKHASKLFEQDSMTPELATDLFYAYQPHTNAQNKDHERFYKQLESYANSVVELAEEDTSSVGPSDMPPSVGPSDMPPNQGVATERSSDIPLAQAQGVATEQSDSNEGLYDRAAAVAGTKVHGAAVAGTKVHGAAVAGTKVHGAAVAGTKVQGAAVAGTKVQGAAVAGPEVHGAAVAGTKEPTTVKQKQPANVQASPPDKKKPLFSEYGDSDTVKFEHSHTLSRLMARNRMDSLPDLPRTSDEMDVRQAQLLGISETGDAVWGVPDKGEIRHLSDDELEEAFMEQYGEKIAEEDISLPEHIDIPPVQDDDYSFFDQMADDFNQQWNDEDTLMQEGVPTPDEQDAPPLPDENDVPPLSFDGLDEKDYQHER